MSIQPRLVRTKAVIALGMPLVNTPPVGTNQCALHRRLNYVATFSIEASSLHRRLKCLHRRLTLLTGHPWLQLQWRPRRQ